MGTYKLYQGDCLEVMKEIENIIGVNNCSKYWWLFQLGKTEDEWAQWYYVDRYKE